IPWLRPWASADIIFWINSSLWSCNRIEREIRAIRRNALADYYLGTPTPYIPDPIQQHGSNFSLRYLRYRQINT
ncbi:hypothetical protein Pmar_PMAR017885, partial [Perkinsus marinus ATCC 50983]